MNELDQAMQVLGGDNGTVAQVLVWMGALRVAFKLFSGKVQAALQKALDIVLSTESKEDDAFATKILASKPYRLVAFVVDWIASVKLPLKLNGGKP